MGNGKRILGSWKKSALTRGVVLWSFLLPVLLAFSLGGLGQGFYRYGLVIIGFSAIIFVHELGHFVVARMCSVKCEVFALGMGPRMLGWRKGVGFSFGNEPGEPAAMREKPREEGMGLGHLDLAMTPVDQHTNKALGETDYRICWLPLGGYVRMLGQDDMDPTALSDDPRAFNSRPIWQRMCIVSAGVVMNLIFAAVVFAFVFRVGVDFQPARIGAVAFDSPADQKGLQTGDTLIAINGYTPKEGFLEFSDLMVASALSTPGDKIMLEVERSGNKLPPMEITPAVGSSGMLAIGVAPLESLNIARLTPEDFQELGLQKPELAKLRAGDRITAVNGDPVTDFVEFYQHVQAAHGEPVRVTLENKDASKGPLELTIKPDLSPRMGATDSKDLLGLVPRVVAGQALAGGPAEKAGIKPGDIIVRVGATANPTFEEFLATIKKNAGQAVQVTVLRGDATQTFDLTPVEKDGAGRIDLLMKMDWEHPVIAAGTGEVFGKLMRGSTIVSVNGQKVTTWNEVLTAARTSGDKPLAFEFKDPAGQSTQIEMPMNAAEKKTLTALEYQTGLPLEYVLQKQHSDSLAGAIRMGLRHTGGFIVQVYSTLRGLVVLHTVPVKALNGPLGIAKIGYDAQERGVVWLLYILAMVSVNLAVANFLPLPIVDGGLFVLLIIEKILGKPLPANVLATINAIGLFLLVGFGLFVTLNNDLGLFFHGR